MVLSDPLEQYFTVVSFSQQPAVVTEPQGTTGPASTFVPASVFGVPLSVFTLQSGSGTGPPSGIAVQSRLYLLLGSVSVVVPQV